MNVFNVKKIIHWQWYQDAKIGFMTIQNIRGLYLLFYDEPRDMNKMVN